MYRVYITVSITCRNVNENILNWVWLKMGLWPGTTCTVQCQSYQYDDRVIKNEIQHFEGTLKMRSYIMKTWELGRLFTLFN